MFGFAQWDSPVALVLEASLSVAIIVALMFVVRRVNARAAADRERYLQSMVDHRAPSIDDWQASTDELGAISNQASADGDRTGDKL